MSDTQQRTGGPSDTGTSHETGGGAYAKAISTSGSRPVETAVATAALETVSTSRLEGSIRVRLVPISVRDSESNTSV